MTQTVTAKVNGLDQAALVLGKYLSPRLYVAYGVGLFEAADSLGIGVKSRPIRRSGRG